MLSFFLLIFVWSKIVQISILEAEHKSTTIALWSRTAMNWVVSTGPLACPFTCSLTPLTHSLAMHCFFACTLRCAHSFTHSFQSSWENQDVLNHSAFGSSSALEVVVVVVGKSFMGIVDEILGPVDIFVPKLLQPLRKPTS